MVFAQFTQTIRKREPFPWIFRRNSFVQLRSSDFFSFLFSLSLSFLVFPFFCFPFYLPFVPLQVNGDTSVYRFPVRLVYWLFIAVQIYRRSFGTNRNAPGQPEDPIFLTMPVISAPSSRVQLVKTERQRERESRDQLSGRRKISLFLPRSFLPSLFSFPLLGIQDELFFVSFFLLFLFLFF